MNRYSNLLNKLKVDYLLVNSTNEFLTEYSFLSENARYKVTGFSGSTGDALITNDKIYLFVDGRYHIQADNEVFENISVVKLQAGQLQDDEIKKIINSEKILGIVSKKVSQKRLEGFREYKTKLLDKDPILDYTEAHSKEYSRVFEEKKYIPKKAILITNLEEVSYITGLRDFSHDNSSKIWAKLFIEKNGNKILFKNSKDYERFLANYNDEIYIDKTTISAFDYKLIKHPIDRESEIKFMKSIKTEEEIENYKKAFKQTDKVLLAIREFIEKNDNLSEYDIAKHLKEEFIKSGAKNLSFNSIVAINEHSALAHYSKNDKNTILKNGDLVLIDCGAYYESGLATDITRVFVKGCPNSTQKRIYTKVLKAFLNCYHCPITEKGVSGFEIDRLAHTILDADVEDFEFIHGLGHGIGINVHETPPALNKSEIAHTKIVDNMTFTIEPGLYNPKFFGIRLENSCYMKEGKISSLVKFGYEGKLIDYKMLNAKEKEWLKEFEIL